MKPCMTELRSHCCTVMKDDIYSLLYCDSLAATGQPVYSRIYPAEDAKTFLAECKKFAVFPFNHFF